MGYAYGNEFPNCGSPYPNIEELLCLYRKLTTEYTELLADIQKLQKQLDDYMAEINTKIPGWIDDATKQLQAEVEKLIADANTAIAQSDQKVNEFLQEYNEKVTTQLQNQNAKVCAALNNFSDWVLSQLQANQQSMENLMHKYDILWNKQLNAQNKAIADMLKQQNQRVDSALLEFMNQQAMLEAEFNALNQSMTEFKDEVEREWVRWDNVLKDYNTQMRLWYYERRWEDKQWLMEQIAELRQEVEDLPQSTLPVNNPIFSGEMSSINQWIEDEWNYCWCKDGYSAVEWQLETWITCGEWNARDIDALTFYINCKHEMEYGWNKYMTFSPVSGKMVWIGTAIQEVFNALNPTGIKAAEYDGWNLDAAHYDAQNITAKRYLAKQFQTDFTGGGN